MTGRWQALLRLLAVQGTWNYERMLGVGMGYAAEPLLEDLKTVDPVRHGEAVVRSAEFFNCNPNLAGLALGATARAEYEDVPGAQIAASAALAPAFFTAVERTSGAGPTVPVSVVLMPV